MKSRLLAVLGVAATLVTGSTLGVIAQSGTAPGGANAPIRNRPVKANRNERHPEMLKALRNLNQAKNNLTHAAKDFGGHREQALDLTQRAIAEVKEALKYDKK